MRKSICVLLGALALAGCEDEPYCLTCADGGGGGPMDATVDGAMWLFDGTVPDGTVADADRPDGCIESELCNDWDDDCDGTTDEGFDTLRDPMHCGGCGTRCNPPHAFAICEGGRCMMGDCDLGFYDRNMDPSDGCEYRCSGTAADDSVCNLRDDDCDGMVDEDVDAMNDPVNCGRCGRVCNAPHSTASCVMGACALGGCDAGFVDVDMNPDNGCEYACTPMADPTETCNARDDDCDGTVDEGNPGGGMACGMDVGACMMGAMTCVGGRLRCEGSVEPRFELCDMADDDCDGMTDEDFPILTDLNNCGMCGNVCSLPNAIERCDAGTCVLERCEPGWVDLDPAMPGCDLMCTIAGAEVCNGRDDDCDTMTDDGVVPPPDFCNPNGVCAGTTATCSGAGGWVCTYGADFEATEVSCDGLDNDCDGFVDEPFVGVGDACGNGTGACRSVGMVVCNAAGDGIECTAPPAGMPASEECNGVDDDCDGDVDERVPDDPGTAWRDGVDLSAISTVAVTRSGGGTIRVMAYEASRPDATAMATGTLDHVACSRANVQPWINVTWDEAQAACCALNPSGTCGATGWRLCDAADWETACDGPTDTCTHSYATMCTTSQPTRCNGAEHDCNTSVRGDQDCLYTTGSPTFPMCHTDWGAAGDLYDMSGNVREWTATARGGGLFEVRGGSMNHIEEGRSCQWDFTIAQRATSAPNTGFRCCMY